MVLPLSVRGHAQSTNMFTGRRCQAVGTMITAEQSPVSTALAYRDSSADVWGISDHHPQGNPQSSSFRQRTERLVSSTATNLSPEVTNPTSLARTRAS